MKLPRIVIELIFMSQAMQIYKTTNAFYLLFYVAAHHIPLLLWAFMTFSVATLTFY